MGYIGVVSHWSDHLWSQHFLEPGHPSLQSASPSRNIHSTPQKAIYKWYILATGGLYATYHLLLEPKTTIDSSLRTAGSLFKGLMGTSIASMPSTPRDRSTKHVAQTVLEVGSFVGCARETWRYVYILGVAPSQDSSGKWRFMGIP